MITSVSSSMLAGLMSTMSGWHRVKEMVEREREREREGGRERVRERERVQCTYTVRYGKDTEALICDFEVPHVYPQIVGREVRCIVAVH